MGEINSSWRGSSSAQQEKLLSDDFLSAAATRTADGWQLTYADDTFTENIIDSDDDNMENRVGSGDGF